MSSSWPFPSSESSPAFSGVVLTLRSLFPSSWTSHSRMNIFQAVTGQAQTMSYWTRDPNRGRKAGKVSHLPCWSFHTWYYFYLLGHNVMVLTLYLSWADLFFVLGWSLSFIIPCTLPFQVSSEFSACFFQHRYWCSFGAPCIEINNIFITNTSSKMVSIPLPPTVNLYWVYLFFSYLQSLLSWWRGKSGCFWDLFLTNLSSSPWV